ASGALTSVGSIGATGSSGNAGGTGPGAGSGAGAGAGTGSDAGCALTKRADRRTRAAGIKCLFMRIELIAHSWRTCGASETTVCAPTEPFSDRSFAAQTCLARPGTLEISALVTVSSQSRRVRATPCFYGAD